MTPWTSPGLPAPSGGGDDDAAVVVGTGPEAEAFAAWLTGDRGIPAARVVRLPDPTPAEVRSAVAGAGVRPGGQLWGVVVGAEVDLAGLLTLREGPAVWWVDAEDTAAPAAVPAGTALVLAPGATPLALGALRGWADADRDGATTTTELADFCVRAGGVIPGVRPVGRPQVRGEASRVWSLGAEPAPPLALPAQVPVETIAQLVGAEPGVKGCFASGFDRGALPRRVTLRFRVPPSGIAAQIGFVEPDWQGSPLEACLVEVVGRIPFPWSSMGSTVTYPFVLQ